MCNRTVGTSGEALLWFYIKQMNITLSCLIDFIHLLIERGFTSHVPQKNHFGDHPSQSLGLVLTDQTKPNNGSWQMLTIVATSKNISTHVEGFGY